MKKDLLKEARNHYMDGHYQQALSLYLKALVRDPDNPQIHCGLGEALEALNRPGEALLAFDQSLRLDPEQPWAHFGRGGVLQGLGRYEEAVAAYQRAAELAPAEVAFHRVLGLVYYLLDELEASLRAYRRAIEVTPEDALSHYGIGLTLDAMSQPEGAIRAYLRAGDCDPTDPWPHLRLAGLLRRFARRTYDRQTGTPRKARQHLGKAISLLKETDYWGQAVRAALEGHREEALEWVRQAVQALPESADWIRRDPDLEPLQADERFWLALLAGRRPA